MEMTRDFEWVVEVEEDVLVPFQTAEELKALLAELEQVESGQLRVYRDYGPIRLPWWKRLLGYPIRHIVLCFSLYWCASYASLNFADEHWSEYRAIDHVEPVDAPEDIRLQLSGGEPTPAPPKECLQKARAFAAAREFIDTGKRPDWLSYRYVR